MSDRWLKQTVDQPLFPNLIWAKPEHSAHAGKLLIFGGNAHGFKNVVNSYKYSVSAGAGAVRALLPDSLKKVIGEHDEHIFFAPSEPSGGFGESALAELIDQSEWADAVLLAGELGSNSQTSILLEKYLAKYSGLLILGSDSVGQFLAHGKERTHRHNTILVSDIRSLSKLSTLVSSPTPVTSQTDLYHLVEIIGELSSNTELALVIKKDDTCIVSYREEVSTTSLKKEINDWPVKVAAYASVWAMQNQTQLFEALNSALVEL